MATATNSVNFYGFLAAVILLALGSIIIWSRRDLRMRLLGIGLSFAAVVVVWFAFAQLPGKPNGISTEAFRANYRCATILPYPEIQQKVGIYMLVRKKKNKEPEYLMVEWNVKLAASLQKGIRAAKQSGKPGSIIYAAASCQDEDEGEEGGGSGKGKKKGKKGKGKGRAPGQDGSGSSGQAQEGDSFEFYPDAVPPLPEKEGSSSVEPLIMPDR